MKKKVQFLSNKTLLVVMLVFIFTGCDSNNPTAMGGNDDVLGQYQMINMDGIQVPTEITDSSGKVLRVAGGELVMQSGGTFVFNIAALLDFDDVSVNLNGSFSLDGDNITFDGSGSGDFSGTFDGIDRITLSYLLENATRIYVFDKSTAFDDL